MHSAIRQGHRLERCCSKQMQERSSAALRTSQFRIAEHAVCQICPEHGTTKVGWSLSHQPVNSRARTRILRLTGSAPPASLDVAANGLTASRLGSLERDIEGAPEVKLQPECSRCEPRVRWCAGSLVRAGRRASRDARTAHGIQAIATINATDEEASQRYFEFGGCWPCNQKGNTVGVEVDGFTSTVQDN